MKRILAAAAMMLALAAPAASQMSQGNQKTPLDLQYERERQDQQANERAYNDQMKRLKSQAPTTAKTDPWAGVRAPANPPTPSADIAVPPPHKPAAAAAPRPTLLSSPYRTHSRPMRHAISLPPARTPAKHANRGCCGGFGGRGRTRTRIGSRADAWNISSSSSSSGSRSARSTA